MAEMPTDNMGRPIPVMRAYGGRILAATTSSQAEALPTGAEIVTICTPDALAYIKFGTSSGVTVSIADDGFDASVHSGSCIDLTVPAGSTHVAVILASGTSTVSIFGRR